MSRGKSRADEYASTVMESVSVLFNRHDGWTWSARCGAHVSSGRADSRDEAFTAAVDWLALVRREEAMFG